MKKYSSYLRIFGVILLLITTFSLTYAWYINNNEKKIDVNTSVSGGYFAGGDGTIENPYIIKNRNHLYNLAWLQYFGRFQNKKYYFEVTNDINMNGMVLPPIGTDTYPFIGDFNGNNYTISNFSSTNDYNSLTNKPNSITNISSSYVGMFGIIGSLDTTYDSTTIPSISSFYIDNYQTIVASSTKSLSGILAGYINGKANNIGIHFAKINYQAKITPLDSYTVLSKYTLFGDYNNDSIEWKDDTGGDGLGYGSSFDVQRLLERLNLIKANNGVSSKLPPLDTSNDYPTVAKNNIIPLTVSNELTLDVYTGENAEETPSNENIGYFCGNQNKINKTAINFTALSSTTDSSGKITYSWSNGTPRTFFKRTGNNATTTSENILAMTEEEIKKLPTQMQNLLYSSDSPTYYTIRLQKKFEGTYGVDPGKFYGKESISYFGKTYYSTPVNNSSGSISYYAGIYLPNNGIWFKPKLAGKFRFIVYSGSDGKNFDLYKLSRGVTKEDSETEEEFLQRHFNTKISSTTKLDLYSHSLPANALFYFEYDVTEADLNNNVEFLIANDSAEKGAYFLYLDIGTNGGSSTTNTNVIENVDFVYKINDVYSAFSNKSNVTFSLTNSNTVVFYFKRIYNNEAIVYYYVNPSESGTITKSGTGKSQEGTETDFN